MIKVVTKCLPGRCGFLYDFSGFFPQCPQQVVAHDVISGSEIEPISGNSMLSFAQHSIGLVYSALIGVIVLVADPGILVIITGSGVGIEIVDEAHLCNKLRIIVNVGDNHECIICYMDIVAALFGYREGYAASIPFMTSG